MLWRAWVLIAVLLLAACARQADPKSSSVPAAGDTPVPAKVTPDTGFIQADAGRTNVTVLTGGAQRSLLLNQSVQLRQGDGVDVDEKGQAILRFSDFLTVEVLRDGELIVQELDISDKSALAVFAQSAGAFVNETTPSADIIDHRVTIETEFAIITATGTKFMIAKEANSPLEWVFGLEAGTDELYVQSKNDPDPANPTRMPVESGVARWIAPIGVPSAGIAYNADNVKEWLAGVEAGDTVPEVGTILWPESDLRLDTAPLAEGTMTGQTFDIQGVTMNLAATTDFGDATYTRQDCNDDGIADVVVENGVLDLDFRKLLNRVSGLDVTLMGLDGGAQGTVQVFDPAQQLIGQKRFAIPAGEGQIVSLRADQPYHYARIALNRGCFLGVSLPPTTPARGTGRDGMAPVPAVDAWPPRSAPLANTCEIIYEGDDGLNLRTGPGTAYDPPITALYAGTILEPFARSRDGTWIQVWVVESEEMTGWVSAGRAYVRCELNIGDLPVGRAPALTPTPTPAPQAYVRIDQPGDNSTTTATGFLLAGESSFPFEGTLNILIESADGQPIQTDFVMVDSRGGEPYSRDPAYFQKQIFVDTSLPDNVRVRVQQLSAADNSVVAEDSVLLRPLAADNRNTRRPSANGLAEAWPVNGDGFSGFQVAMQIDGLPYEWQLLQSEFSVLPVGLTAPVGGTNCPVSTTGLSTSLIDLAAQALFAYDYEALYVAFFVQDDSYVGYSGRDERFFLGDSPQIILDLDLGGDLATTTNSADDVQIDLHPGEFLEGAGENARAALWRLDTLTAQPLDAAVASSQAGFGYFVEAAIPWNSLGLSGPPPWGLGLAASVSDNDVFGTNQQQCMISMAPNRDFRNPTTWGTLDLVVFQ